MYFYEVAPASRQYHGSNLLTYSSETALLPGDIIVVKIRSRSSLAFVVKAVTKPDFKTAPIAETLNRRLPATHLKLFNWLLEYYPAPLGTIAQLFLPLNAAKDYAAGKPIKAESRTVVSPPALTAEQVRAIDVIDQTANTVMLHGDTGTGKTRVYIEATLKALASGKSVLVLVPEIALSPQIVASFKKHIDAPIHVTHSGLTPVQRRKAWQAINDSIEPQIVIGPRSAMFTPLSNVGLIVIDEFHEPAYKQDQAPYYQTLRVVSQLARLHEAKLIMGSATPPVAEYYVAEHKNIPIVRMQEKAVKAGDNKLNKLNTLMVNLKDDGQRTKYPLISSSLIDAIKTTLNRHEQSLLFLNKRGSARMILCQNCGWHATCPNCDLPLTYHGDTHRLQCHTCGYNQSAMSICPSCSSYDIIFKSPGTKAIVDAVQYIFPEAKIARFDKDNLKAERLDVRHEEVVSGDIDILIGTQMLAKGHDLPRLGLVGILLAENELQFPDYTSSERSYQLMHQLIGRVGRGHRAGTVVVQTYDPDNLAVKTALREQTWDNFYQAQIKERQLFGFPPFYYMMKIEISRARPASVATGCDQIINFIRDSRAPVEIIGPSPSFIEKRSNTYNWQIIVKAKRRNVLTHLATTIPVKCTINLDPSNLL